MGVREVPFSFTVLGVIRIDGVSVLVQEIKQFRKPNILQSQLTCFKLIKRAQ